VGSIGFPIDSVLGSRFPCDQRVVEAFSPAAKHVGPIATVSTCSATDNSAREVARRTGALAETMEGAACALVAHRRGIPFAEVRAISNYTGARANQRWDIQSALEALDHVLRRVLD
jgi:futalosine hydrolase